MTSPNDEHSTILTEMCCVLWWLGLSALTRTRASLNPRSIAGLYWAALKLALRCTPHAAQVLHRPLRAAQILRRTINHRYVLASHCNSPRNVEVRFRQEVSKRESSFEAYRRSGSGILYPSLQEIYVITCQCRLRFSERDETWLAEKTRTHGA